MSSDNEAHHKAQFDEYIANKLSKSMSANCTSSALNKSQANCIIEALTRLRNGLPIDRCVKGRIKNRNFCLIKKSGGEMVLGQRDKVSDEILEVGLIENYYEIIKTVHDESHSGINTTQRLVKQYRTCVTQEAIERFVKLCPTCNPVNSGEMQMKSFAKKTKKPVHEKIESKHFWEHCQLDFIDMKSEKYDGYKWIAHVMCRSTNFHVIWPMKKLTASKVANDLVRYAYCNFGPSKILQCGIDADFNKKLLSEFSDFWQDILSNNNCEITSSGWHYMRENQTLMKALAKKKIDENTRDWPSLLPDLMYDLNTTFVSAINKTPFKAVFNFDPKLIRFELEEEIEDQENESAKNGDK